MQGQLPLVGMCACSDGTLKYDPAQSLEGPTKENRSTKTTDRTFDELCLHFARPRTKGEEENPAAGEPVDTTSVMLESEVQVLGRNIRSR
eukprot:3955014-Amphidinium_carterae.1